jgi:hypothetical protein
MTLKYISFHKRSFRIIGCNFVMLDTGHISAAGSDGGIASIVYETLAYD